MEQQQPDERPATEANVDQLLDELQQLVKHVKPADQRLETESALGQAPGIVAKGR